MSPILKNLYNEVLDLDKIIPLNYFFGIETWKSGKSQNILHENCNHLGYLVKDGKTSLISGISQRIRCKNCGKRFGSNINEWNLYEYQYKIKQILYELFIEGCKQKNIEKRWGIPQDKVSRFKKKYVGALFEQHPRLLIDKNKPLRYGLIYGDETFFGKRGNSNQEVIYCNEDFEILATISVIPNQLKKSINSAFKKIPVACREKLRVLVTDGEPSYKTVAQNCNHRVIHVQQYHSRAKLGQITINKYQQFGPHTLHYQIHTHWKIFVKKKYEFGFKWEIKFIPGPIQSNRGRPSKEQENDPHYIQWRQKRNEYRSNKFEKSGSARVFINLNSKKISLRRDSKQWMKKIFHQLLPIFHHKCITNNRIESKNSQIKRCGENRKQPDRNYSDKLVQLYEFISQYGKLPKVSLDGRPLYKYLMIETNRPEFKYQCLERGKNFAQKILSSYM